MPKETQKRTCRISKIDIVSCRGTENAKLLIEKRINEAGFNPHKPYTQWFDYDTMYYMFEQDADSKQAKQPEGRPKRRIVL